MQDNKIDITRVTIKDLDILRRIGIQTFTETFAPVNTKEDIDIYLDSGFTSEKLTAEINNPDSQFYFINIDNNTAGYLKVNLSSAQTELQDPDSLEIERIYVLQEFQGQNAGQLLFSKAMEISREHKLKYVWLGVWEKNLKAIKFYEKNGFSVFDKHSFKLGNDLQTDILMKKQN